MFPPASFDPTRILPLTSNEFISRILVPEVALRLIMEDRDLEGNDGMQEALIVLRESSIYGVAMFPEDGGEGKTGKKRRDDALWVGDKIVMERARKRRKELEEEEEQEEREETKRIAEVEAGIETQVRKKGSKKRKGKQREEQPLEEQPPVERPRPRPRPVAKASSSMSVLPLLEDEELPQLQQPYAQLESPPNKRITRAHSTERSDSAMDDFYVGDEDDVNFLDIKTPVRKRSRSSDEQTPKPLLLPLIGGSNDNIKPLMIARSRQSQKNGAK
jgi:RTC4-like domain